MGVLSLARMGRGWRERGRRRRARSPLSREWREWDWVSTSRSRQYARVARVVACGVPSLARMEREGQEWPSRTSPLSRVRARVARCRSQKCASRKRGPDGFARPSSHAKPLKYRARVARVGRRDWALPTGWARVARCRSPQVPSLKFDGRAREWASFCESAQPWRAEMTQKRQECQLNYYTWQEVRRSES